ncbi:MAG: hypothetical protein KGL39_52040, partial [Patescibacteria group bacterium]|nr:hypothetical protein [Patescibacteria group bacterium]
EGLVPNTTSHAGDKASFDFDQVLDHKPFFAEWENDRPLAIGRIVATPCELASSSGGEIRVVVKNEDHETVGGSFGASTDDELACKKPIKFEKKVLAEVSGPAGQRVRFSLKGRFIPPDED